MLLVKSKELKNSNKKISPSSVLAGLSSMSLVFLPAPLLAKTSAPSTPSLTSASSILNVFLSLLVVVAIIFALAYIMRRFNVAQSGGGQMRVVASMMAGAKEKVMVIEVGDEQHLLGITANSINHLAKLENPIQKDTPSVAGATNANGKVNFQQKLVHAMAQSITGGKSAKEQSKSAAKGVDHD
jgi:flagellar protein FliO/FliZ